MLGEAFSSKQKSKLTPAAQKFISGKIRYLVKKEHKPVKQAVAISYSLAKQKGFA